MGGAENAGLDGRVDVFTTHGLSLLDLELTLNKDRLENPLRRKLYCRQTLRIDDTRHGSWKGI